MTIGIVFFIPFVYYQEIVDIFKNLREKKYWQVYFQEEVFEKGNVIRRKTGKIIFRAPLIFKIDYGENYIFSDGKFLNFVFPEKKKVYTKRLTDSISENLIIKILSGSEDFLEFFDIKRSGKNVWEFSPKENSIKGVKKIKIYTAPAGFPIEKVEIISFDFGVRIIVRKVSYRNEKIDFSVPENFQRIYDSGVK